MKKSLFCFALLISGSVFATTDHYVLRDGKHVHHLKITQNGDEITASSDVDFEPNADEKGSKACSADIADEAKSTGKDTLTLKKKSEEAATSCVLNIKLSPTGAKIEQSEDCSSFVTGICHFSSDGKELVKIK
ncbi:hypothetical protein [Methyloglobulus sp.]|jgi:hypothetical protein|uniref:hypothetical protein n=1 Tax=Methyloglobulus sp. TaxID=2518622 RepID=UPI0032B80B4B